MISPAFDLPRLEFRPSLIIPSRLQRLCAYMVAPLRRLMCGWQWRRKVHNSVRIRESIQRCVSRRELDAVLGRPQYSLNGTSFGYWSPDGTGLIPDIVEVYRRHGCDIDIWFKDGEMVSFMVLPAVSWWDLTSDRVVVDDGAGSVGYSA